MKDEISKEIEKIRLELANDLLTEINRYEPFKMEDGIIKPEDEKHAALKEYGGNDEKVMHQPYMIKAIQAWALRNKIKGNIKRT